MAREGLANTIIVVATIIHTRNLICLLLSSFVLSYLFVFISRCSLRLRLCSLLTLEVAAKSGALHALTDENKMKGTFEVHILVVGSLRA